MSVPCAPGQVVADRHFRPRFWATAWVDGLSGRKLKHNSRQQCCRHLNRFYSHCDAVFGADALDEAIGSGAVQHLQDMAESFYLELTKEKTVNSTNVQCWKAARAFLQFFCKRRATGDQRWTRLSAYLGSMQPARPAGTGRFRFVRALPVATLQELLDVCSPESPCNPFASFQIRVRNWLLLHLMLVCGLRRGEALLLKTHSLKSEVDGRTGRIVRWLDVTCLTDDDDVDRRATRPSIKTNESHRQVPVSESVALIYEWYVEARGDAEHDYLLNSRDGPPLSAESVNRDLQKLSDALSADALKRFQERSGKKYISPHDLRHTCATARYKAYATQDPDRQLVLQRMRAFFGWSKKSEMPEVYARAAIQEDLLSVWSDLFDDRIRLLRRVQ